MTIRRHESSINRGGAMMIEDSLLQQMREWRHHLHRNPEFGFEEVKTASFVASKLRSFGVEVTEGIGGTGVVGTLTRGSGNRAIALRADMDALRIGEKSDLPYRSQNPGVMHACGHDGHTAMLLGAARILATDGGFDGTVRFVFQPAEEWGRGAIAMLDDGLLERFPFSEIYGIHNMPGIPIGRFATRTGPIMAAEDVFEIKLNGMGGHAARPHHTKEVLVAACALVMNLQTIVSRSLDPAETAVVSVTEIATDGARNILPGSATILGDARSMRPEVSLEIEDRMRRIADATATMYECAATVDYRREFVPLINTPAETDAAVAAATGVFGGESVDTDILPIAASEDFARFLEHVPGNFAFVGNGDTVPLHNASFDFDDSGLAYGTSYLVAIARDRLA